MDTGKVEYAPDYKSEEPEPGAGTTYYAYPIVTPTAEAAERTRLEQAGAGDVSRVHLGV